MTPRELSGPLWTRASRSKSLLTGGIAPRCLRLSTAQSALVPPCLLPMIPCSPGSWQVSLFEGVTNLSADGGAVGPTLADRAPHRRSDPGGARLRRRNR
jgi:hypothetical protein